MRKKLERDLIVPPKETAKTAADYDFSDLSSSDDPEPEYWMKTELTNSLFQHFLPVTFFYRAGRQVLES